VPKTHGEVAATVPQSDPQRPTAGAAVDRAGRAGKRARAWFGVLLGALVVAAGSAAVSAARAQHASDTPEPAEVPEPPEQASDDESLIELPIAPAATSETNAEEPPAPDGAAPQASAALRHDPEVPQQVRVLFPTDEAKLDEAAESELRRLAGYLNRHGTQRVVLRAHAADGGQGSSHARRVSLTRALAVRTFLVDSGVPADRIYLRPLGSEVTDGPPDRVDILPLRP
jgi:outer membrane protein OmpA-like peptidoglycan-associated protein